MWPTAKRQKCIALYFHCLKINGDKGLKCLFQEVMWNIRNLPKKIEYDKSEVIKLECEVKLIYQYFIEKILK